MVSVVVGVVEVLEALRRVLHRGQAPERGSFLLSIIPDTPPCSVDIATTPSVR